MFAVTPESLAAHKRWFITGGVIFDADARQVVDENGVPVPIEEMTTKQLRAELQLRKHPISGNKADLYRRLELARTGKRPAPRGKAAQAAPSPVSAGYL